MKLEAKIPSGALAQKWELHRSQIKLVNPANKRKYEIIVVGTGLAGASAAAALSELGYGVKVFCFHDSPRRAHSIAAQGGINAAKNYQNDGDSIYPLFHDARASLSPGPDSTLPRTTRTTGTASTGFSTTRSRGATSVRARRTCIGWP